MEALSGVITSMLTPFTDSFSLDEETLAQELEHQISKDVHGICVLGGTGESLSLTAEERLRVVEVAAQVVKGRVPLVVGCFVPREDEIVSFAQSIEDLGATALMLTPPPFYKVTPSQFGKLLENLNQRCTLSLVIYNAPGRVAVNMGAEAIAGYVARFPNIIGVKDATGSIREVISMGYAFGSQCGLLQGLDDGFLPALASGADGGILAFASPMPEIFVDIYDSWNKGDNQRALEKQLSLIPVMGAVAKEPMPVLVKEAMKVVGRPLGPTRPPLYPSDPENAKALRAEVEKLLKG
jgi:4-hydroxy-tetrahydrodipicolinate synthase